jgi:hypothetical protein
LRTCADCGSVIAMKASDRSSLALLIFAAALAAIAFTSAVAPPAAAAENAAIASRQRAEKKTFTDVEITDGFLKTAFGAEYHLAGRVDRIRKYDVPVRVFADSNRPDRKAQLAKVVADIGQRIAHLDIAMAETVDAANIVVKMVRDRDLFRTITSLYGSERAREIKSSLDPQCLSGFRKSDKYEIEHSEVILTVDNGDFVFLDCAYEELLQSLGPINDTALDHVQRQCVDGILRHLRPVHPQRALRPAHQGRHDGRGGQGGAARGARGRARVGQEGE